MNRYTRPNRRKGGAQEWHLIYMDLITNLTIFFVIIWTLSAGKNAGVSDTVGDQTVRMVTLPGDVLFSTGQSSLSSGGTSVFQKLFSDNSAGVLDFETGGLVKRLLVIHGHTDGDGGKEKNFDLGFRRAFAVYQEIQKYGPQLADHVILCSHADNSPAQEVPKFQGQVSPAQEAALREAKSKNRRITIEDTMVNTGQAATP